MKKIIIICVLFFCKDIFATTNYTINKKYDDNIFYDIVLYQNQVYFSSNKGVYVIDPSNANLIMHDETTKGTINSNLTKNPHNLRIKFIDPPIPLSETYSESVTDFLYHKNYLYILSKGDLLVYKNNPYNFSPYASVRTISENCVGTYNGVFIDTLKLKKTRYTDGQIREFDSIIFICYNGLTEFKNNKEKILYDNDNSKLSKAEYGLISDIFLIENSNYLVLSSKGIYHYNYNLNSFDLIYSKEKKIIPVKNKIDSRIEFDNEFHFIDGDKYLSLNTNTFKTSILHDNFNYKLKDILECSFDGNIFYGIGENKSLLKFVRSNNEFKLLKTYQLNILPHTITDSQELIFLSGNDGLSLFEKSIEKLDSKFIVDEFNTGAVYKSKNDISFGSIHGIYKIEDDENLIDSSYFQNSFPIKNHKISVEVIVIMISLILFLIIFRLLKSKNLSNEDLVIEIKKYITKNLSKVTLQTLQDKFDLEYSAINNLQKGFSPAKFIKQERNNKAKEMFLNNQPISKISHHTGYSESYLLKNKYIFLK